MAEIKKGILGGFSGTVGTVVGTNWRGKDIIKSRPRASRKAPTAKQLEQRVKFSAAVGFLTPLKEVQNAYFGSNAGAKSRLNLSVSQMIREAMEMNGDVPQIIFNKVQVTKGELAGLMNPQVATDTGNVLEFTWEDNSDQAKASADDVFCTVSYCSDLKEFHLTDGPATRSTMTEQVSMPAAFAGKEVQVYAFLHAADSSNACNSVYLGAFTLQ